jgi:hypothetical protein
MVTFLLGLFVGIVVSGLITLYGGYKLQQKQEEQEENLMRTFLNKEDINEFYKRYES